MGPSIWQLLIVLVIVLLLFGTKRLRGLGGDLGTAIKSFKSAVAGGEEDKRAESDTGEEKSEETIEGKVSSKENEKV